MSHKRQDDTLKQLEKLLANDAKNEDTQKGFSISNRDLTGIAIRISVSLTLILILYFTGIFKKPISVSLAILFIISIEITRYIKGKKYKTGNFD